jgi:hypothetical protein
MHSLKAVLLLKGKVLPSFPVAYVVQKQEKHENMKEILSCVNYKTCQWRICDDLKVIAILMDCNTQNSVVSYATGIVMTKLFTTARRTGFNVNHIHLEQRT